MTTDAVVALSGSSLESPPEWISYVMKHSDLKQCANLSVLSKQWHEDLSTSCSYWKQLCVKLAEERKLYLNLEPFEAKASLASWKDLFRELWEMRNQFVEEDGDARAEVETEEGKASKKVFRNETERSRALEGRLQSLIERSKMSPEEIERLDEENQKGKTFSIGVCVRFKPPSKRANSALEENKRGGSKGITLPLHQRLPLIKAKYGKNLSNSEAMKKIMMMEYGVSSVPRDPWANAYIQEEGQNQKENQPSEEQQKQSESVDGGVKGGNGVGTGTAGILAIKEEDASVLALVPGTGLREFKFDKVFESKASNPSVHLKSSQRVVGDFINGFNGTVMVYGQTGSGKTYTMFGKQPDIIEEDREEEDQNDYNRSSSTAAAAAEEEVEDGIAQMACREVLEAVKKREESDGIKWRLAVTYVEVYGQDVYDLLKEGQVVGQSRVAGQRYVLDGQTEWPVNSWGEIQTYLEIGSRQKRKACTAMNERSSRAHTVFILSLTQKVKAQSETAGTGDEKQITSKLMLVDLGGSEKLSKSRVHENVKSAGTVKWETYYEQRKHLTEALYINTGLFALKACIEALHEKQEQERMHQENPSFKKKHIYVPYQDSKLTMILSSSLGGNARTVMIVTASKDDYNALETFQSLRFGEQCSSVKNTALCMSKASLVNAINELEVKIKACEELVKKHERWETKKVVRKDMERDEIVTVTVPVGAELYRKELEELLQRKETLLGGKPAETETAGGAGAGAGATQHSLPAPLQA